MSHLRDRLNEAGLSYESAAAAVRRVAAEHGDQLRTNKSAIAHWVAGNHTPDARTVVYLCEALSRRLGRRITPIDVGLGDQLGDDLMPRDAVGAVARLGRADVDRRGFLTGAVYSLGALALPVDYKVDAAARSEAAGRGRVGAAEVETVREITAVFNAADERLGGGFGRSAVVEYLASDVARYCDAQMTADVRAQMFSEAAQLAYLAGWKAHDIGSEGLAQRYYLHSYQLAIEAGETGQAAYVMRILAHQAYDLGHHDNCIGLASAAVRTTAGRVDDHTAALFSLTLAKAHAMKGDRREALTALARAELQMQQARDGDERPRWAGIHGTSPAQFHNHTAKVLADLGEHAAAEAHFATAIRDGLDPVSKPRVYALSQTWLAEAQVRQGHLDQACETWGSALDRFGGIQSNRARDAVKSMRGHLAPFRRRGVRAVAQLDARGRELLAAA
ncbi:MAG: hypothetical protein HOV79_00415 [Hamadaea sp.]|nr:hypothetical protein [Hamadaea sp.]